MSLDPKLAKHIKAGGKVTQGLMLNCLMAGRISFEDLGRNGLPNLDGLGTISPESLRKKD